MKTNNNVYRSDWTWQTWKISRDNVQTQTECSSAATGLDAHLWESLEDDRAVRVEVEDSEALHLLGDAAGRGELLAGLPGEDGEHGGVVGGVLPLGEGEGAGASAVVGLVGGGGDHGALPADRLQVDLQRLQAAHRVRALGERLAGADLEIKTPLQILGNIDLLNIL